MFTRQPVFSDIEPTIIVTSPVNKAEMPVEYTQIGTSTFPPLSWTTPEGTKELLLVVEDADVPTPSPAVHGFYYGIPPTVQTIESEDFAKKDPKYAAKGIKVVNNALGAVYSAPRPLLNHGPHRYFFQVIALKEPLVLKAKPSVKEVLAKIEKENIVAWGEWEAVSERRSS